ncbi:MAG: M50 family metallopeptidase [Oscillospiraceae bacterium]|nr:M50 family metallopeptidase [Oscillospiraceae bacterium]
MNNHPKFSVSIGAAAVIAAFFAFGEARLLLLIFIAASVHELGHYMALRLCGGGVVELRLGVTGMSMRHQYSAAYIAEIFIAAGGPIASAVLSAIAAIVARQTQVDILYHLAGMSLLLCVFNLLPALPMDGGRILYAAVSSKAENPATADRVICMTSCVVIFFALTAGACILAVTRTNFSLLAAAAWILIHYCKSGNNSIKY